MIGAICDARNETGVTWAKVAREMDIAKETLRRWVNGATKVPKHRWRQLARAIGIDPDDFDRNRYNREFAAIQRESTQTGAPAPLSPAQAPSQTQHGHTGPQDDEKGPLDWFAGLVGATSDE